MRKNSEKMRKIAKLSEKSEKIYLNFASLCFASQQKLLNRSEAKNIKRKKKRKKNEKSKKMRKNAKNSEKK